MQCSVVTATNVLYNICWSLGKGSDCCLDKKEGYLVWELDAWMDGATYTSTSLIPQFSCKLHKSKLQQSWAKMMCSNNKQAFNDSLCSARLEEQDHLGLLMPIYAPDLRPSASPYRGGTLVHYKKRRCDSASFKISSFQLFLTRIRRQQAYQLYLYMPACLPAR